MAKTKIQKTRNGGTMTEAQYFGKLRSLLRRGFMWWIPMKQALEAVKRPSQNSLNKRLKFEYQCAECGEWFPRKDIHIDHIYPCGSLNTYEDLARFVQNLTPEDPNAYQILCKDKCHREKTNWERKSKVCTV